MVTTTQSPMMTPYASVGKVEDGSATVMLGGDAVC